jgi:ribonuclease HI
MADKIIIFTDGACRGNPGEAGIGIVILKQGKTIKEISEYIGKATNNIAEYAALLRGLKESAILNAKHVEAYSDSELLVKQINGEYQIKNQGLKPIFRHIQSQINNLSSFSIKHIPRERNAAADKLANQAIDNK